MNKQIIVGALLAVFSISVFGQMGRRRNAARKPARSSVVLENLVETTVCDDYGTDAIIETFTGKIVSRFLSPGDGNLISFAVRQKNGEEIDLEIDDRYLKRENPAVLKKVKVILRGGKRVRVSVYACGKTHWAQRIELL